MALAVAAVVVEVVVVGCDSYKLSSVVSFDSSRINSRYSWYDVPLTSRSRSTREIQNEAVARRYTQAPCSSTSSRAASINRCRRQFFFSSFFSSLMALGLRGERERVGKEGETIDQCVDDAVRAPCKVGRACLGCLSSLGRQPNVSAPACLDELLANTDRKECGM